MSMDGYGRLFQPTIIQYKILVDLFESLGFTVCADVAVDDWAQDEREDAAYRLQALAYHGYDDIAVSRLYPFQQRGSSFIRNGGSVILADAPGLGKTASTICALNEQAKYLVLCPKTLISWWVYEIGQWQRQDMPIIPLTAPFKEHELDTLECGWVVTNWESVRNKTMFGDIHWSAVVGDESQKIKSKKTLLFKAVKALSTDRFIFLTGTPMSKDPSDLWTMLNIIQPSVFTSFWRFREWFCEYNPHDPYSKVTGIRNNSTLQTLLSLYMLRRTIDEVGIDLPPKTVQEIPVEMPPQQRKAYKDMATKLIIELESGENIEAWTPLALLTRLRQLASTTATLDKTDYSGKLDYVMDEVATGEKLVVFTTFRNTVTALSQRLEAKGIKHVLLMGGTPSNVTGEIVSKFQTDPSVQVLIGTVQTGGVGLTLTAASRIIFIDRHYNPTVQEQAEDRVYRIGQKNHVHILIPYHKDTVDEQVKAILEHKLGLTHAVLKPELEAHLMKVARWKT